MAGPLNFRQAAANSGFTLGAKIFMAATVYATHLVLARLYGAELMGTFFISVNIITFLGTLATLGQGNGLLRFAALLQEAGKLQSVGSLLWRSSVTTISLGLMGAIWVYGGRGVLSRYFHAPLLTMMMPFFALVLPLIPLTTLFQETLRGLGRVVQAATSQFIVMKLAILGLLGLFFLLKPFGAATAPALGLAFFLSVVLTAFTSLGFLKDYLGHWWTCGIPDRNSWLELRHYSYIILLNSIMVLFMETADSLILALFRPPREVAYYGAALKVASLVALPLLAINAVVPPLMVRLHQQGQLTDLQHLARTTTRWVYSLALPLCLLFILVSRELLGFFGAEFAAAHWALIFLAVGQLINVGVGSVSLLLNMTGNHRTGMKILGASVLCTLPLMFLLAAALGVNGLGFATALGYVVVNVAMSMAVWRVLKVKTYPSEVGGLTILTLAAFFLALGLRQASHTGWLEAALIFLAAYLLIFFIFARKHEDWGFCRSLTAG